MNERPLVLVVDDDDDCLAVARLALEASGYRVIASTSPAEALAAARRQRPAVIVTDLVMGELDAGIGLAREVRRTPGLAGTRVLIVTSIGTRLGYDLRPQEPSDLAAMGADAFLAKPFAPLALVQAVRGLCAAAQP